jgi:hypothetical protein
MTTQEFFEIMNVPANTIKLNNFIEKNPDFNYNQIFENSEYWDTCFIQPQENANLMTLLRRQSICINIPYISICTESHIGVLGSKAYITLYQHACRILSISMLSAIFQHESSDTFKLTILNIQFNNIFHGSTWSIKNNLEKFIIKYPEYNYNKYFENKSRISYNFCNNDLSAIVIMIKKTNIDVNKFFQRIDTCGDTIACSLYTYALENENLSLLIAIFQQKKCNNDKLHRRITNIIKMHKLDFINAQK